MKKSEIYQKAILAVIKSGALQGEELISVLRELFERESLELYAELAKAKKED